MYKILLIFMDLLHILIGLILVFFILWLLIRLHGYFSKDNYKHLAIIKKL